MYNFDNKLYMDKIKLIDLSIINNIVISSAALLFI